MNSISSRVEQIQQPSKDLEFLFGTRATGVCETHKCTHTSCLPSQTHIDSRDYNYRHSHNVASRYAASVIASPVATWQQRSLATAAARRAASGPASLQHSHIWICMSGDQARCRRKTLAGVFSLFSAVTVVSVKGSFLSSNLSPSGENVRREPRSGRWGFLKKKTLPVSITGENVLSFKARRNLLIWSFGAQIFTL